MVIKLRPTSVEISIILHKELVILCQTLFYKNNIVAIKPVNRQNV